MDDTVIGRWAIIRAPLARVWQAISTGEGLAGWFAGEAAIEARDGGALRFTGPGVLGGGDSTAVRRCADRELLEFDWTIVGERTVVLLQVRDVEAGCRVTVRHSCAGDVDLGFKSGNGDGLHTMWSYLLGSLKAYVELGTTPLRLDYAAVASNEIRQSITVEASRDRAFAALTAPAELDAWIASGARVDPRPGGRFSLGWPQEAVPGPDGFGPSNIVAFEPGTRVSYAWNAEGVPTVVEWRVEGDAASARITLAHSGFLSDPRTLQDYGPGWADYLVALAIYLATGQRSPAWGGRVEGHEWH